jgi:hypothetical protein
MPLVKHTPLALESDRRDLPNRVSSDVVWRGDVWR